MRTASLAGAALALASSLACLPVFAVEAGDYVHSPIVEYGEREIDFKYGTLKNPDGTRESAGSVGLGWGVTPHWFTEVYAKWHKEPGAATGFDAYEWENLFQLTETGKYPVDVGLLLEVERPKDRTEGYDVTWGPLFQADITPMWQANLNFLIEKHYRAADAGPAELGYQWQLKYRWKRTLEFGAQGFGNVGPLAHWDPARGQQHMAGPAVFGKFDLGAKRAINYNAAVLFGLDKGAPHNGLRVQAEYEF